MEMDQNRLILGRISHSSQDFSNLFWLMELGSEVTTSNKPVAREARTLTRLLIPFPNLSYH